MIYELYCVPLHPLFQPCDGELGKNELNLE